ncbi:hypothetical protein [Lactiplantibacillus plantarum]|uniref:hypothetical protein n=1 Tax=Lactiplantibacillus plantarum TaxID=1590 RepID=UPI0021A7F06B|nr:hypothetical protein [Lactiplantibacillus plantarum]MCT3231910.1 hypothetical protein [Lactiplantibacillus plantarum]MCT3549791.1 hypothetical protein [Lactiplantibacillus plantarum]
MNNLEKITIWEGTPAGTDSLKKVVDLLLEHKADIIQKGGHATYKNINVTQSTEINNAIINDMNICYTKLDFSFDVVPKDDDPVNYQGYVIAFSSDRSSVRYFVSENGVMAQKVLQLLFNNYNKSTFVREFKKDNHADFLFWLFANYINNNGELDSTTNNSNKQLQIRNVNAIRGSISERITTLSAKSNDDIANYISVLSFLLETDEVDKLGLAIKNKDNELIEFVIDRPRTNQTVSVDTSSYVGTYDNKNINEKTCLILFLVHLEILPQLRSLYLIHEETWINSERDSFLKSIGLKIKDKVDTLTDNLSSKLNEADKKEA